MTLAYGFALSQDWDRPYWAGFAVAFVSLSTLDDSLDKAMQRLLGTFLAAAASLTIIALSIQDRWLFMVLLSGWVACATYLMKGTRYQYLWFVAGFVTAIICMDAGPNSVSAFDTAVLRTEQTTVGIVAYSLVAALLWPSRRDPSAAQESTTETATLFPDPVRLGPALKVCMLLWLGYLAVIFIPDFPGGGGFVGMLTPVSMMLVTTPQLRPLMLIKPLLFGIALASLIYVLVLPGLSRFGELGMVIFGATFIICYLFYAPQKMLGRAFGLAAFVVITGIDNQQTYNFLSVTTTSLMFAMLVLLLVLTEHINFTFKPRSGGPSDAVRAQ
jgi:hypothetical protein